MINHTAPENKVKRILRAALGVAITAFLFVALMLSVGAQTPHHDLFPELLITEICADTYGFTDKSTVLNESIKGIGSDTYEFIEIYNNSDHRINIYDYCLLYNGDSNTSSSFEKKVNEMTPFESGKDWIDGWDSAKYWTGKTKMPENPAYEQGYVEPGRCVVIWVLYYESHVYNCTVEEFRAYWSIPDDVLVICFDGNSESLSNTVTTVNGNTVTRGGHTKNFNVKNSNVGTYSIAKKTDEFAFGANRDGVTLSQVYTTTDEIISWAVMDFTNILSSDPNYVVNTASTVNFIPSFTSYNGLYAESGGKRTEYLYSTPYERSTVGRLTLEQERALGERYVYLEAGETLKLDYNGDGILSYYVGHVQSGKSRRVCADTFKAEESGVYVISVRDVEFVTGYGASVRTSGDTGIRFASYLNKKAAQQAILTDTDIALFRMGTLICPRQYVEECGGELTEEKLKELGFQYLDVRAGSFYGERNGQLMLVGSVLSIMESHYLLEYSARGYIDVIFKDGTTRRIYATFDIENNSRSPYEVALAAYNYGEEAALRYIDGVCDLRKTGAASVEVRSYTDALDGILDPKNIVLTQKFSCRSDANLNVWIMSENKRNPRLVFVDGTLAATLSDGKYTVNEKVAFSATSEDGGAMVSLKYECALAGLEGVTKTKTDAAGVTVLDGVKVSLKQVYSHAAQTTGGVKYYILQSCCSDGRYIYYCMNNGKNMTNMVTKAELETGKIVTQTYGNAYDHANGITYNVRTHELVIVHNDNGNSSDSNNKKWISVLDADTLELKKTLMLSHKLYALDYDARTDQYLFGVAGKYDYVTYTADFKYTGKTYAGVNTGITKQDMSVDRNYVMYPQFTSKSSKTYSYLSVFTRDTNKHAGLVELHSQTGIYYEIEDCFSVAGQLYFAYYCSGYGFRLYKADVTVGK